MGPQIMKRYSAISNGVKRKKKTIGLLGGICPEATEEFYLALISKFQKKGLIESNKPERSGVVNKYSI